MTEHNPVTCTLNCCMVRYIETYAHSCTYGTNPRGEGEQRESTPSPTANEPIGTSATGQSMRHQA